MFLTKISVVEFPLSPWRVNMKLHSVGVHCFILGI